MFEILTGAGLATSAGLNAFIPMLALGLLDRFTSLVDLPPAWSWLSSDASLWILGVLLVVEVIADKIPAVDTINDAIQTVIRPAAGGITFASGIGTETTTVTDPDSLLSGNAWVPIAIGVGIALVVHLLKAGTRVGANTVSVGTAAPVLSTAEDVSAAALSLTALFLPVAALFLLLVIVVCLIWGAGGMLRRRTRRRQVHGVG